ncbi:hypothetical protein SLEP1_g53141 [Rubroshorea leprosula]|uniref:Uncharacterized protein n=1 Tax=Rubroshorea leprosula TaxID=152421 RepID=A0AAV5MAU1_9ROSI|nr:hypothetical protein SLEP1_g53141 [Rubroshorea leprosula]
MPVDRRWFPKLSTLPPVPTPFGLSSCRPTIRIWFPEVAELLDVCWFEITGRIDSCNLSPMTRYHAFLVFKLAAYAKGFENKPIDASFRLGGIQVSKQIVYVDVDGGRVAQNGEQYPKERGDGWVEVELGEFFNGGGELEELEIHILSYDRRKITIAKH